MEYERLSSLTQHQRDALGAADCMRYLSALTTSRGANEPAMQSFLNRWPRAVHAPLVRKSLDQYTTKAAVPFGTTTDPAWAGPLAQPALIEPVLALVQQQSLLGRIPGLRRAPFNTPVPIQTAIGTYYWVQQGVPKPITKLAFDDPTLPPGKIAGIVVLSSELVKLSAPFGENAMRDALVGGAVHFQDGQMLDPTVAEVANVHPPSITNGVTPVPSTGDLNADVAALLAKLYTSRPGAARPTLVMSPAVAGRLAASGNHPQLTVNGGTAFGCPVVTASGAALHVVALDAAAVLYADGGIVLDISTEAAVEMVDNPAAPTATTIVASFWQLNLAGFKVERLVWWVAAPGAVQVLTVPAAFSTEARQAATGRAK
jgi:hypothetical protein